VAEAPRRIFGTGPRLLSDNGPSYVVTDLGDWLERQNIEHTQGAPCHPENQGKIERWYRTLKTGSCSKLNTCKVISKIRLTLSSSIPITGATIRA
jgi:hypothetical protein